MMAPVAMVQCRRPGPRRPQTTASAGGGRGRQGCEPGPGTARPGVPAVCQVGAVPGRQPGRIRLGADRAHHRAAGRDPAPVRRDPEHRVRRMRAGELATVDADGAAHLPGPGRSPDRAQGHADGLDWYPMVAREGRMAAAQGRQIAGGQRADGGHQDVEVSVAGPPIAQGRRAGDVDGAPPRGARRAGPRNRPPAPPRLSAGGSPGPGARPPAPPPQA